MAICRRCGTGGVTRESGYCLHCQIAIDIEAMSGKPIKEMGIEEGLPDYKKPTKIELQERLLQQRQEGQFMKGEEMKSRLLTPTQLGNIKIDTVVETGINRPDIKAYVDKVCVEQDKKTAAILKAKTGEG